MTLLILGLILWVIPHSFKLIAPGMAKSIPEGPRKGAVALLTLVSLVLMVVGYRAAPVTGGYVAPSWGVHVNNLLMLISVYLFAASGMKTAITRVVRHPQYTAVILWAIAHLLVHGDIASILLFGVLLVWAVVGIILSNAQMQWTKPTGPVNMGKEIGAVIGTLVVVAAIGYVHILLGYRPFGG
ncbi:MAG: hypothetical protein GC146_10725 [Limimaricola sp.]|uniref:NnrU family protein n=1 Tax=Limimaricola sp. TaxID=2211665 RepID=UPI001D5E77AF|nr:NnrU family protein [Limimaricola sp.]MBI1417684.1 hypothetical protein [Limimaricola sp.]